MTVSRKSLLVLFLTLSFSIQAIMASPIFAQSAIQSAPVNRFVDGGTVPKSQTPTFDWSAVTGANTYTLEICKAAFTTAGTCTAGLAIPAATLIPSTTYTPTVELPRNVVLYWRVRGVSTVYGAGPWSAVSNFLSANAPPKPVASLPAATVNGTTTPTLTWSTTVVSGTNIPNYDLQVCTTSTCASGSVVVNTTQSGSVATGSTATLIKRSWQVSPALENGTQYYWRVRSKASNGNASGWSASLGLKTIIAAPAQSAPLDNADLDTTTPTFIWNSVTGATSYAIEVSKTGAAGVYTAVTGATALPATTTSFTPAATIGVPTAPNTQLYWRVKATSTTFGISYSTARRMTPAQAPTPPTLTAITAIQTTQRPLFKWVSTKVPTTQEPTLYELQLATNTTFTQGLITKALTRAQANCVQGGTATSTSYTCSYTIDTNLATGTSYYWRVRAESSNGDASSYTAIATTTPVKIGLINAPSVSSPANNSTADLATPTFTWSAVTGATGYTVQTCKVPFSATGTCTSILVAAATVTTNSWTPTVGLPTSTPTYWNVRANSTLYGNTPFSNSSYFVTAGAPLPPTLVAFAGAQPVRPIFKWSSQKTATSLIPGGYELQIATDAGFTQNLVTKQLARSGMCTQSGTTTLSFACTYTLDTNLSNGTSYFWRVRAETGTGVGDDSSAWVVNAAASPLKTILAKPTLNSPISNSAVDNTNPVFSWDKVPGATTYAVQRLNGTVWAAVAGTQTVSGDTVTLKPTASVVTNPLGGSISWRVTATSTLYGTSTSDSGSFVSAAAPTAPVLTQFPATAQTTLRPTFRWYSNKTTATLDPTSYELQIAKDVAFTQGLITKSLTRDQAGCVQSGTTASLKFTCAYPLDVNLSAATTYQWRVRAKASSGDASAWVANGATTPLKIGITDAPDTGTPTVTAALTPNKTTSTVNSPITLTASSGGTATGTTTYEYRCKATDAYGLATSSTTFNCTYTAVGTYVPSVRATRQGISATADSEAITIAAGGSEFPPAPAPPASAKKVNLLLLRYNTEKYTVAREALYNEAVLKYEDLVENLSRPHGYKNAASLPKLDAVVKGTIKRTGGGPTAASSLDALNLMLTANNNEVCNFIVANKVDQLLIYFGDGPTGTFSEEYFWVNKFNSSMCGGQRSFFVFPANDLGPSDYGINTLTLHALGHMMEDYLSTIQTDELFYGRYAGVSYAGSYNGFALLPPYNKIICGNIHFAPFATSGEDNYDYHLNKSSTNNSCEDWKPDNSGVKQTITSLDWSCTPNDDVDSNDCYSNNYYIWWFNNMPNSTTPLTYQGKKIPAWTEFMSDMDATLEYYGRRSDEWFMNTQWLNTMDEKLTQPWYLDKVSVGERSSEIAGSGSVTFSHQHSPAASKPFMLVAVSYRSGNGDETTPGTGKVSTLTFDGKPLTLSKREIDHQYGAELWYLPVTSGANTTTPENVVANFTGPVDSIKITALTFAGVDQTAPMRTVVSKGILPTDEWGISSTHTLSIPSVAGDIVFGLHSIYSGSNPITTVSSMDYIIDKYFFNIIQTLGIKIATSTSQAMSWSTNANYPWETIGVALKKAP